MAGSQSDIDRKALIAKQFIEAIPHARDLGMRMIEVGNGAAKMAIDYREDFIGDPNTGVIHGGVVSALLDTCCGAAVFSHPAALAGTATIDLRIDYMRGATPHQTIVAHAECYRITKNVAFVRAQAFDDSKDDPVATVAGAFTVERDVSKEGGSS